jgi:hypothetical protein
VTAVNFAPHRVDFRDVTRVVDFIPHGADFEMRLE